ncbi:MAG: sulfotransferase [Bacteroidota bacterium]
MERFLFKTILLIIATGIEICHWLFLGIDHLFFPSFRNMPVEKALFITGMPRTGSSYFFNALLADSERFTAMKLWEILFAPSIIQKKLLLGIRKMDRRFGNRLYKKWVRIEQKIFKEVGAIHPLSLLQAEEDEFLFLHRGKSASFLFLFPRSRSVLRLVEFDESLPLQKKSSLMRYYRKCIQRHLYVFGKDRQYLAKSASHTPRLLSLKETFPDCHLVYLYRSPMQVIPSTLNLFRFNFRTFHSRCTVTDIKDITFQLADRWYSYPLLLLKDYGPDFLYIVRFDEMTGNIRHAIENMYRSFQFHPGEAYLLYLERVSKEIPVSPNRYSLSEFSLSESEIRESYQDVMLAYDEQEIFCS